MGLGLKIRSTGTFLPLIGYFFPRRGRGRGPMEGGPVRPVVRTITGHECTIGGHEMHHKWV